MRFLACLPLVATVLASSPNIFERQDATIDGLVDDITSLTKAVTTLGDGVSTFSGIADAGTTATNAQAVQDALEKAVENAKKAPMLDENAALKLAKPAQDLNDAVLKSLKSISDKKQAFVDAQLISVVAELLSKDNDLAKEYSTELFSKVPDSLKETAKKIVQPCLDELQKTVDAFKGAGGGAAPGGTSSAGTSSSSAGESAAPESSEPASSAASPSAADNSAMESPMSSPTATGTATAGTGGTPTTTPEASTGAASTNNVWEYGAIFAAAMVAVVAL